MKVLKTFHSAWRLIRLVKGIRQYRQADDPFSKERAEAQLFRLMEHQRGVSAKIGQFLSRGDGTALDANCQDLEALPAEDMLAELAEAWQCDPADILEEFSEDAAAASLGQVHQALLKDSDEAVAIKIQYPGIADQLHATMSALSLMPSAGPVRKWGVDMNSYRRALKDDLEAELNYAKEREIQEWFRKNLTTKNVLIAKTYSKLSKENILVQEWLPGIRFEDVRKTWARAEKRQAGLLLLRSFSKSIFELKKIHADPHVGNFAFRKESEDQVQLCLYDFGSVAELDENKNIILLSLIIALREQRAVDPMAYLVALGFDAEKLQHIRKQLPALCAIAFAPFLSKVPFDLDLWAPSKKIRSLLGDQVWWFRSAGPSDLLFVMRSYQGLIKHAAQLELKCVWWNELIQELPESLIKEAESFWLPAYPGESVFIDALAKDLVIRVLRHGQERVNMHMPARAVDNLEQMLDEDIRQRIQERGISVEERIRQARTEGYCPQVLFEDESDGKYIRVALE